MAIDFGDLANRYIGARIDQATQPFTDPEAYMNQRMMNDFGVDMNGNVKPRSTTVTYGDNGQPETITTKHDVGPSSAAGADYSMPSTGGGLGIQAPAAMPSYAPPVSGPQPMAPVSQPAPSVDPMEEERKRQQAAIQAQQAAQAQAPAAPVAPAAQAEPAPTAPVTPQQVSMPPMPQPGPGVQVAGVGQLPAGALPNVPSAQPQPNQAPAPAVPGTGIRNPYQQYIDQYNRGDLYSLAKPDSTAPDYIKSAARDEIRGALREEQIKTKGDEQINAANKDPKQMVKLFDEFKRSSSEEGSYIRAYLLNRFGFTEAADDEMSKLGWGAKYEHIMLDNGAQAMVKYSKKGEPIAGIDEYGNKLTTSQLISAGASKGIETSKTFHRDEATGHIISHSTQPGKVGLRWKDETTGDMLDKAPASIVPISYQDAFEKMAVQASKTAMDNMRRENTKARSQGAPEPFSESQILEAGTNAANAVRQGHPVSLSVPGAAGAVKAAPIEFKDPSIKVLSADRTRERQQQLYDQSVAAGTPGRLPNGNLVAKPGTSQHEVNRAIDVDSRALTPAGRRELAEKGYYQPHGDQDPNHWELLPGKETPAYTPSAKKEAPSSAIDKQARAIYEGNEKPPTGMGAQNYRARAVMDRVHEIAQQEGRPFDPTMYAAKEKTRKDFSGSGQAAKTVQAMNVAIDHLDTLREAATALQNGNIPLFNQIGNLYAKNTGQSAPTNFEAIQSIVGNEVAKAVSGAQMALKDREEIRQVLDAKGSPDQIAGTIDQLQKLLAGQLKGLRTTYESAGLKDFDTKLNDRTKQVLLRKTEEPSAVPQTPAEKARAELERRRRGQQ